jgi:uroporphyrin-III C-methyltransferase
LRRASAAVCLKGDDPFVCGRGGEDCKALRAAGVEVEVEVVNGLNAGIAAPAAIGIPVTDRRFTQGVALVTGHCGRDRQPDWSALAASGLTLVIRLGVARLQAVRRRIGPRRPGRRFAGCRDQRGALAPATPCAVRAGHLGRAPG